MSAAAVPASAKIPSPQASDGKASRDGTNAREPTILKGYRSIVGRHPDGTAPAAGGRQEWPSTWRSSVPALQG